MLMSIPRSPNRTCISLPKPRETSFYSRADHEALRYSGDALSIKASGQLKEAVVKGSKLILQVALKKGAVLIPLIKLEQDLCDQLADMGEECPLEKGTLNIVKAVDLPKSIPPSEYIARANAVTEDGKEITCFVADINF